MRILLIDDDAEIRFLAGFVLRQRGHDVVEAASGAEALLLCVGEFDLLLVDVELGDARGDELLPRLRERGCAAPAAYLTGTDDPAALARLDATPAIGRIAKPFDAERLADQVEALLPEGL
mgnify:CR=1 FL=1